VSIVTHGRLCAPERLRQRHVGGHLERRSGQPGDAGAREPLDELRPLQARAGADVDEGRDQPGEQDRPDAGGGDAQRRQHAEQQRRDHDDGDDAAGPGGLAGRAVGVARDLPERGAQDPSAVQREPRQQVEPGDQAVGDGDDRGEQEGQAVRLEQLDAGQPETGQQQRHHGPDDGDGVLPARRLRRLGDLGQAGQEGDGDAAHRQAERTGHHAVPDLVQQHAEQQQHREGGRAEVRRRGPEAVGQGRPVDQDDEAGEQQPGR
jgi:hypothetical protein